MRKALLMLPVLFAYLLVLGHNFIPHTHVEHNHSVTSTCDEYSQSSHDHSGHEHNHDSVPGDETETDPTGFAHLFMHFAYSPHTPVDISFSNVTGHDDNTANDNAPSFLAGSFYFFEFQSLVPFRPPVNDNQLPFGTSSSSLLLRGPPVLA